MTEAAAAAAHYLYRGEAQSKFAVRCPGVRGVSGCQATEKRPLAP